jgi:RNA 3'-terminal phosphate cyclase (ATP)
MIEIDGSSGEGGGQIVRTALSLSALLGVPCRIRNIRRSRPKPGLRAQHLAAVRAIEAITDGEVKGAAIGSEEVRLTPRTLKGGAYRFEIGTAGSTPLVLQTLLPPLAFAEAPSHLSLSGGTHVPISLPFHFVRDVFLPFLAELTIEASASIKTYGFYPRGGGEITAEITPVGRRILGPMRFPDKKTVWAVTGVSAVANLPLSIGERQKEAALKAMGPLRPRAQIDVLSVPSPGVGTFVFLKAEGGACRAGFTSIGVRGKRAETVGMEAGAALLGYHAADGCIDPHLADQLVIYLSLAEGISSFTTTTVTRHLVTNLATVKEFLPIEYTVEGEPGSPGKITVKGVGYRIGTRP